MSISDIRDIKLSIDTIVAKKIFGNAENAIKYLEAFNKIKDIGLDYKNVSRGKKIWTQKVMISNWDVRSKIVTTWDYEIAKDIIRWVFIETKKYLDGKKGDSATELLMNEWKNKGLWDIKWPFSQWAFDSFVQSLNSKDCSRDQKDEEVKSAAVKYRRIKEINTVRNDYLETLIFDKNTNIIPTLSHSKWVDFFIEWVSFDQKVARSPTNEFKRDFGENRKQAAIDNPVKVAQYLYQYQDEGRFGAGPRLLVVYLDEDVSPFTLKEKINKINLNEPLTVTFEYSHWTTGIETYSTKCFVILLHN